MARTLSVESVGASSVVVDDGVSDMDVDVDTVRADEDPMVAFAEEALWVSILCCCWILRRFF